MSSSPDSPQRRRLLRLAVAGALGAGLARRAGAAPTAPEISFAGLEVAHTRTHPVDGAHILILRRDQKMIEALKTQTANLADPDSRHSQQPPYARNPWRSRDPAYLVMINHCTFEGCPTSFGGCPDSCGFSCPCCGSQYDAAGRVHKFQPAPRNMAIPYYRIDTHKKVIVIEKVEKVRTVE